MANNDATESDKNSGAEAAGNNNTASNNSDSTESTNEATTATGKTFTQDELNEIVQKRLSKERSKWEKDKDLSEVERIKKENEELRAEIAETKAFDTFETAATKQGVKNARGLYRAIKSDLEYDDAGKVKNLDAVLKSAKSDLPEFFGTSTLGDADGGKGGESKKTGGSMNDVIRAGFGRS